MQLEASNTYFSLLLSTSWKWWTSAVSIFAYYIFFHLKRCPLSCYLSLPKERNFIFSCLGQTYMTREEESWCIKTIEFATEEVTCLNVRWTAGSWKFLLTWESIMQFSFMPVYLPLVLGCKLPIHTKCSSYFPSPWQALLICRYAFIIKFKCSH